MNMIKSIIDFNEKKEFICDMDGVIYHGNQILPVWQKQKRNSVIRQIPGGKVYDET